MIPVFEEKEIESISDNGYQESNTQQEKEARKVICLNVRGVLKDQQNIRYQNEYEVKHYNGK